MSNAIPTQGAELQRGDGAGTEVFTKVAEVISFQGPGGEASEIDVTSLDSLAKEFRLGLQDEGDFQFECIVDPDDAQQSGLRSDRAAGTVRNFQLVLPDAANTTLSFAALVKSFSISGGIDDVVRASVGLRISGIVVWSQSST